MQVFIYIEDLVIAEYKTKKTANFGWTEPIRRFTMQIFCIQVYR